MKKMMMILALLFAMVGSSFGASFSSFCSVKDIICTDGNVRIIMEQQPTVPCEGATNNSAFVLDITEQAGSKFMYSTLLMAYSNKTNIQLQLNGVSSTDSRFAKIVAVYTYQVGNPTN